MSKVKVNNKLVSKNSVKQYYRKQWQKEKFREIIKKNGVFTRNSFNDKSIIRRKNIKIRNWNDLEKHIDQHTVEVHTPTKNISKSYVDVDIPKKQLNNRKSIIKYVIRLLRGQKIKIKAVTDSPSGAHIFTDESKKTLVKTLKNIEKKDKKFHVGKSSKNKIVLDPYQPNSSIPGSLSIVGRPYKKW